VYAIRLLLVLISHMCLSDDPIHSGSLCG
jgi:hypothetical protein